MRKFARATKKFLFIAVSVVILVCGLIYVFNVVFLNNYLWNTSPTQITAAIQRLTGQMPPEAQKQVFQGGYTILSSKQSSAPQNLQWGLGLVNRDYEEVWCVTAQSTLGVSGILAARKGSLWQIVYPENVPPGNTSDVFLSLNCHFEQGR